jgi:hypothetical protein
MPTGLATIRGAAAGAKRRSPDPMSCRRGRTTRPRPGKPPLWLDQLQLGNERAWSSCRGRTHDLGGRGAAQ